MQLTRLPAVMSNFNDSRPKPSHRVGQKRTNFSKFVTLVYDDVGRCSIYQNVQLSIRSNNDISNFAILCVVLENYTTLKMPINLSTAFNYFTQFPQK